MKHSNELFQCIGIIMDGNRRFAKEKGLPAVEGHRRGGEKIIELLKWCTGWRGSVVLYTFSTENWNRSPEEVDALFSLFEEYLSRKRGMFAQLNCRVRIAGERHRFPEKLQQVFEEVERETANASGTTVVFALSYGGRTELVHAFNLLKESGKDTVSEEDISSHTWLGEMGIPDPDLIIRTGGEKRLSNFLTWQSVYSELFFTDTYWPAFTKEEFDAIVKEYGNRERRRGR